MGQDSRCIWAGQGLVSLGLVQLRKNFLYNFFNFGSNYVGFDIIFIGKQKEYIGVI